MPRNFTTNTYLTAPVSLHKWCNNNTALSTALQKMMSFQGHYVNIEALVSYLETLPQKPTLLHQWHYTNGVITTMPYQRHCKYDVMPMSLPK